MRKQRWARGVLAVAICTASMVLTFDAGAAPATQHCVLQVTGQLDSGELTTEPIQCFSSTAAQLVPLSSGVIARHYTGYYGTGSELDILGSSCTGGWLNMPAGWVNVIRSTYSICTVDHYDYYFLTGDMQRLYSPGGNLTTLSQRTNSAQYF